MRAGTQLAAQARLHNLAAGSVRIERRIAQRKSTFHLDVHVRMILQAALHTSVSREQHSPSCLKQCYRISAYQEEHHAWEVDVSSEWPDGSPDRSPHIASSLTLHLSCCPDSHPRQTFKRARQTARTACFKAHPSSLAAAAAAALPPMSSRAPSGDCSSQ